MCPAPKHYKAREPSTEQVQSNTTLPMTEMVILPMIQPMTSGPIESQALAHPFAHIPEAWYALPSTHNFAAPAYKSKEKEKEKELAY